MKKSANRTALIKCRTTLLVSAAAFALAACSSPEQKVERYYESGMEFLEKDDLPRANIQFQNALKINEDHVPTLIGLSEVAEAKEDFQTLFAILQRIVRLAPDNVDAHIRIGKLYLIGSDETQAMEAAEKAIALDPQNPEAMSLKAGVQLTLGDIESAVALAKRALAINPTIPEAVTVLASERASEADYAGAIAFIDEALEIDPSIAILQLLKISLLDRTGRPDEKIAAYEQIIESHPDVAVYRKAYARELLTRRDIDGAREQIGEVVRLEPDNFDAKMDYVRVTRLASGDEAGEQLLRQLASEYDDADLRFALSDYLRQTGKVEAADAALSELASDSDNAIAFKAKNKFAAQLLAEEKFDEVEKIVDEILAADERNTEALLRRAAIKITREEFDEAIIDIRTAIDNDPDNADALIMMSNAFEAQGNIPFARNQYAAAFDKDKAAVDVADRYARFLARNGDLPRAEEILEQSLSLNPGNVSLLQRLASTRLAMQDWQGAQEIATILSSQNTNSADADVIRAAALTGLAQYDQIIDTFSVRADDQPLASAPLASLVQAYLQTGRNDEAVAYLNNVIEQNPDNYLARILLAQAASANDDPAMMEAALLGAIESAPTRAEAYQVLYQHYSASGQRNKIAGLLENGLAASPENFGLRVLTADIALIERDFEGALEIYADLFAERPGDALVANNYLSLLSDFGGDESQVRAALDAATVLKQSDNPFHKDTLGWAHFKLGEMDEAAALLTAAANGTENPDILYHLGAVLAAQGDADGAREALNQALAAGGDEYINRAKVEELLGGL